MKRILFLLLVFSCSISFAQNFRGQWKGYFIDKSISALSFGSNRCDYVLELDVQDTTVSGYSYTYFTNDGNKYYTICTLKGIADKKNKTLRIIETSRTKTNVPDNISNSFQVHVLRWRIENNNEILEGNWTPAPGQDIVNTGFGSTYLIKRQLTEISALAKKVNAQKDPESQPFDAFGKPNKPVEKNNLAVNNSRPNTIKPLVKTPTPAMEKAPVKKPLPIAAAKTPIRKPLMNVAAKAPVKHAPSLATAKKPLAPVFFTPPVIIEDSLKPLQAIVKANLPALNLLSEGFEARSNTLLQTVTVDNPSVKIELYDNGEVDGDSVSLFYNGKVLLAHKMLSEKAISLELPINSDVVNELVMYADNLGTIPPNTALMIVTDGSKRYEVRITSDLSKSGVIRFIHKSDRAEKVLNK